MSLGGVHGWARWIRAAVVIAVASFAVAAAGAGLASPSGAADGPSFSCAAAPGPIEAAICADPALAARDRTLMALFAAARVSAAGVGPSNELARQRQWLAQRDRDCAAAAAGAACLATSYDERLYDLALAALFTAHAAAMAELRRQTPADAQIYEAIYQYATVSDAEARIAAVAPLIAPTFAATRIHPAQDVPGAGQVPAEPEARFEQIPTPEAAAGSDGNFAIFLAVAFQWAMDGERAKLPCGALVRRPGLMAALGGRFDPTTDCEDALPPTPAFDRLLESAVSAAPPCEGTIRIDIGAAWQAAMTANRLNLPDAQRHFLTGDRTQTPAARRLRRKASAQIAAASAELAHYYSAYFGLGPAAASAKAAEVMDEAVSGGPAC